MVSPSLCVPRGSLLRFTRGVCLLGHPTVEINAPYSPLTTNLERGKFPVLSHRVHGFLSQLQNLCYLPNRQHLIVVHSDTNGDSG